MRGESGKSEGDKVREIIAFANALTWSISAQRLMRHPLRSQLIADLHQLAVTDNRLNFGWLAVAYDLLVEWDDLTLLKRVWEQSEEAISVPAERVIALGRSAVADLVRRVKFGGPNDLEVVVAKGRELVAAGYRHIGTAY